MRLIINILCAIVLVIVLGILSVYILGVGVPKRQKLQFGIKNITLKAENAIKPEALKEPESNKMTEQARKELEIAWGQWHANIHNALLVDFMGHKNTYCTDFNTKTDLSVTISKDRTILDRKIETEPYCEELVNNLNQGIDSLNNSDLLTFPENSHKDKNTYQVKLYLCNKLTNPNCGVRASADKYPEIERYYSR